MFFCLFMIVIISRIPFIRNLVLNNDNNDHDDYYYYFLDVGRFFSPPEMHGNDSRSWKHLCQRATVNNQIPPSSQLIYILFWWDIFFHSYIHHRCSELLMLMLDHANRKRKTTTTTTTAGSPDLQLGLFWFIVSLFFSVLSNT